jgi:hypothetical protein
MKTLLLLLMACLPGFALATSVPQKPLEDILRESDHVVVATIIGVEMVDGAGQPVTDPAARTGPGLDNRLRLLLQVKHVLFTRADRLPSTLLVPLRSMWHYELGDMQNGLVGSTGVFLLRGKNFQPAYPTYFQRSLDERPEIERLLASPGFPGREPEPGAPPQE